MVAAGDTWVALACGRHFALHGVDTVEPFSFNSHKAGPTEEDIAKWPGWARTLCKPFSLQTIQKWHPTGWINQNWLTHLIFYKLVSLSGKEGDYDYNMLVYWKFTLYILTAFAVYGVGRVIGVSWIPALAAACFAMVVGRSFFDIRPAGYSNFLTPVFFLALALATYRNIHWIWLLVPVVVFWANVHGGYIYVYLMLVPFIGLHFTGGLPKKWTFVLGMIGTWWAAYLLSHQFCANEYYPLLCKASGRTFEAPSLLSGGYAVFLYALTGAGVGMVFLPDRMKAPFFLFYIVSSLAVFLAFFLRLNLPVSYSLLTASGRELLEFFILTSQIKFMVVFSAGILFTCLMTWKKDRLVILPLEHTLEVVIASGVSFLAMILLNPFHLTNLTHTFEISVSKHAASWRQVNEWRPAFDWMDKTRTMPNPVGDEEAFACFCILAGLALGIWIAVRLAAPVFFEQRAKTARGVSCSPPEVWPKIDLPLWTLAAMTIYLAVQSRRFIAVAGAVCPFAALLAEQSWQMIGLTLEHRRSGTWKLPLVSVKWQRICQSGLALFLILCAIVWGRKYVMVYLRPWPSDSVRQSVFMRMTASNVKPFEVCDFINGNGLHGRMFNYWTEGGALAFGQKPDPQSGRIPLLLFMDGRAQAAYNHDKYEYWQLIFSGGPEVLKNKMSNQPIDEKKVGQWLNEELKKNSVWVILMPSNQAGSIFMRGIGQTDNWKTVYLDSTQQILADTDTAEGRQIAEAVLNGTAFFPDDLSRYLSTAMLIIETRNLEHVSQMMDYAAKGFQLRPCAASYTVLHNALRWPMFRETGTQILKDFFQRVQTDQAALKKQAGYAELLVLAGYAADYLAKTDPSQKGIYQKFRQEFKTEAEQINKRAVW